MAAITVGALNDSDAFDRHLHNYAREYKANGIFKAEQAGGDTTYRGVQNIVLRPDTTTNMDEINVDSGVPMFARIGDKRGTFEFDLVGTYDLFEEDNGTDADSDDEEPDDINATNNSLASKWLADIDNDMPPTLVFVETLRTNKGSDEKQVRIRAKLRIRDVEFARNVDRGVPMIMVRGDLLRIHRAAQSAVTG